MLDTLSEREAGVVCMRFGLTDGQPKTLDEIGKVYGVTRERIRQIESKTMSKLRHPSRSQVLRDYLDYDGRGSRPRHARRVAARVCARATRQFLLWVESCTLGVRRPSCFVPLPCASGPRERCTPGGGSGRGPPAGPGAAEPAADSDNAGEAGEGGRQSLGRGPRQP